MPKKEEAITKEEKKTQKKAEKQKKKEETPFLKKLNRVLLVIIALLLVTGGVFVCMIFGIDLSEEFLNNNSEFVDDTKVDADGDGEQDNDDYVVEALSELRDSDNLSSILKEWATEYKEDQIMKSKNVINFLLIGIDEGGTNADSIILLSVNKETKKLYLTSFMRDSYTYIKTQYGDKYAKVNAAYANGGAECLIETIENDYKIAIDYYVSVNFQTFKEVVDAIGGVKVPIKEYEQQAMAKEMGYTGTWGDSVLLTGEEALGFCRIRHCDSDGDISRTRRQRTFITALINASETVTMSQVSDVISTLLKYVRTDCSTATLISLATQGLLGKWYNYELTTITEPIESCRLDYLGYAWVWIVDYPAAAQDLQNTIYGTTNITLAEDRLSAIDAMKNGNSGEARP